MYQIEAHPDETLAERPPHALHSAQDVLCPASFDAGHITSPASLSLPFARTRNVRHPMARASRASMRATSSCVFVAVFTS